jgi:DNA polymerase-1
MVMSFDLDAGRSIDGIGGGHGMDELAQRHLGHTCIAFKDVCGTGKKAIRSAKCRSTARPNMPPRMPT